MITARVPSYVGWIAQENLAACCGDGPKIDVARNMRMNAWFDAHHRASLSGHGTAICITWRNPVSYSFGLLPKQELMDSDLRAFRTCLLPSVVCAECGEPLTEERLVLFSQKIQKVRRFLVCICGCPGWIDTQLRIEKYFDSLNPAKKARAVRLKSNGGSHTRAEIENLISLQNGRCFWCNRAFTSKSTQGATRDHILPVFYGGKNSIENIVLACRSCNSKRGTLPFRTFCQVASPRQNIRIVKGLRGRIIDMSGIDSEEATSKLLYLDKALKFKRPSMVSRFLALTSIRDARVNMSTNKPIPSLRKLLMDMNEK